MCLKIYKKIEKVENTKIVNIGSTEANYFTLPKYIMTFNLTVSALCTWLYLSVSSVAARK